MKKAAVGVIFIFWVLALMLSFKVQPRRYVGGLSKNTQAKEVVNRSALGIALGEFRTSLSDMFYMQTESFLHYGVAFIPHDDEEHSETSEIVSEMTMGHFEEEHAELEGHDHEHEGHDHTEGDDDHEEHALAQGHDAHEGHDHDHHDHDLDAHDPDHVHDASCGHAHSDEVLTVIPTAETDFRSWIGEMHRQIKPWQAPGETHRLASNAEVVPLFRMMTLADPHYVKGYQVGAFWIQGLDPEAASAFLEEGFRHNPEAFELYLMRGLMTLKQARSIGLKGKIDEKNLAQRTLLLKAKEDFQQSAMFMLQIRPAQELIDAGEGGGWSIEQETDAMAALNLAVELEHQVGEDTEALRLANHYLQVMPKHKKLLEFIQMEGDPSDPIKQNVDLNGESR